LESIEKGLQGFRAATFSTAEKIRRTGQLQRFLSLVPIEYRRGVQNGQVTKQIEMIEAITFCQGAAAAFTDLETDWIVRNPEKVGQVRQLFEKLKEQLDAGNRQVRVEDPEKIASSVEQMQALIQQIAPAEWLQHSTAGDFAAVATVLDQVEHAVAQGQYDQAESARLEAYAIMDTGPEAKLVAFAPQFIPQLETLFWYGDEEVKGLAKLLQTRASLTEIKQNRVQLDQVLQQAQTALGGSESPAAVMVNSAMIVFREGLEAILIIAALMAGFQRTEYRHLRPPLWWGALASLVATVLTWFLARGILLSLARYGERLEAIMSLVTVLLLLLITNWFFHKSYWTDWLRGFQSKKWGIAGSRVGQWMGMAMLGFDSIYREGFETVLFLQALVLDTGPEAVLEGVALGSISVVLVGIALFKIQLKLPYKKMLIVTGTMIVSVLATMVGSTAHLFQVIGWLPVHPIRGIDFPYWTGLWFGLFPTYEGIGLQMGSVIFVLGSYVIATWLNKRKQQNKR
jgi:high-affinity iron transporter